MEPAAAAETAGDAATGVLDFLQSRGFARAADALRSDICSRNGTCSSSSSSPRLPLPPVKIPRRHRASNDDSSSGSSDAFVSMGASSPSDFLNPYGVWSPVNTKSEDSSIRHSEFDTARDYNDSNVLTDSHWYNDMYGEYLDDSYFITMDNGAGQNEDKFVTSVADEKQLNKEEIYGNSLPLCDCCSGIKGHLNWESEEVMRDSSSAIYGRFFIMPDETERLDEFEQSAAYLQEDIRASRVIVHDNESPDMQSHPSKNNNSFSLTGRASEDDDPLCELNTSLSPRNCPEKIVLVNNSKEQNWETDTIRLQFNRPPDTHTDSIDNTRIFEDIAGESQDGKSADVEVQGVINEPEFFDAHMEEYEIFDLRIIHRKNRTGFEENKDFPIVLNSIVAGRYVITEFLGSAAFSKVVQAHDLHMGIDVSIKIIKNDKDFFDQSLDEIKLLKFVNKHDPVDKHHILRLYDYFYHQEHLFIVCELLKANLYEFQKYNQDCGEDIYFTLPRIQRIARQCLEALVYLHGLKIIHCDLKPENILMKSYSNTEIKIIDLGSSCFLTDNLGLYVQSRSYRAPEVILGLPYDQKIDIWSLGCIFAELYSGDVLFTNDSLVTILARMIGILGPIDMEMLVKGQDTPKYFTDSYELYYRNEETDQIKYLTPKKSSLAHQLHVKDRIFIDFLQHLLQINPKRRPTAAQALKHPWLFFSYS